MCRNRAAANISAGRPPGRTPATPIRQRGGQMIFTMGLLVLMRGERLRKITKWVSGIRGKDR
jgi:hypothetical protein